jgi:prepilin-type N-terminal cleavage/methylation domain-containing protein
MDEMTISPRKAVAPGRPFLRRGGFTLIEILVAVGIMVLLTSIVVMATIPALRAHSLGAAARQVHAMIYEARTYAATQRCKATLYFDTEERSITLFNSPLGVPTVIANRVQEPEFLPRGVAFQVDDDPLQVVRRYEDAQPHMVFAPGGSLDPSPGAMAGVGNWTVRLVRAHGNVDQVKVIEVVFASGLVKVRDE